MINKINSKIIAAVITIGIIIVLFLTGSANAVRINMETGKIKAEKGTIISLMPTVSIDSSEIVNINYVILKIRNSKNEFICKFHANGSVISGCDGITISISSLTSQYGYRYGNNYESIEEKYGYGYGYGEGNFGYLILLNSSEFSEGVYKTEMLVSVGKRNFTQKGGQIQIKEKPFSNRCSIRASDGNISLDNKEFSNNKIGFYMSKRDSLTGTGSLTGQKDRDRFNYRFKVKEILEETPSNLKVLVAGNYRIGRNGASKIIYEEAILNFDRITNRVSIIGDKIKIKTMIIDFIEGCDY